ncbi:glutathione S-transferase [Caulobacter ginsengisoli]|uniref:Glutathione S-transferase n=1 Tax=Caulobacter ginsengisoli TaxID=400775 RepID=A0ABU0IJX1_9CAUL|nr:glutathione S-transferase family protein [Caulobacter ginsengisoli]MDQ0462308.1 glutathione S-transferase [Caulobacter ginsengisoli]
MLILYTRTGSCSLASHIALEEAGAAYETREMDFSVQQQRSPEYLALNPKGRIPALVTDRGVLSENLAILAYIAQAFPQARLAPTDPFEFGRAQAINAYLSSTVHVAHAHRHRGYRWADDPAAHEAMRAKVASNMAECFTLIETEMLEGPWVLGEAYSICDPYLFTIAGWLEGDGVDPAQFPKVSAHMARMVERPAVRKVLAALT